MAKKEERKGDSREEDREREREGGRFTKINKTPIWAVK